VADRLLCVFPRWHSSQKPQAAEVDLSTLLVITFAAARPRI
jgi:hypothetical protein